jgi:hypothetical protein
VNVNKRTVRKGRITAVHRGTRSQCCKAPLRLGSINTSTAKEEALQTGEATASIAARVSAEPNQIRKHARCSGDHDLFPEWNPIDRWTRLQSL